MMTSSNGNIFHVTGPLCGEFTGRLWIPRTKASFDVFFDLRLNKRLSKQSWGWWFETPSYSSWRHCNALKLPVMGLLISSSSTANAINSDINSTSLRKSPLSIRIWGLFVIPVERNNLRCITVYIVLHCDYKLYYVLSLLFICLVYIKRAEIANL